MLITMQHTWVKHVITPVQVLEDDDGEPVVLVDPDDQMIAEDNAVYGCSTCCEPMVGNLDTECKGEDDE